MAPWPEPRRPWCVSLPARSRLCHMVGHGCPQLLQLLFPIEPDGSCCHLPLQWGHESQLLLPNPVGTTFFPSCGTAWGHRQGHSALRRRGHSSSLPVSCVGALPSAWRQRPLTSSWWPVIQQCPDPCPSRLLSGLCPSVVTSFLPILQLPQAPELVPQTPVCLGSPTSVAVVTPGKESLCECPMTVPRTPGGLGVGTRGRQGREVDCPPRARVPGACDRWPETQPRQPLSHGPQGAHGDPCPRGSGRGISAMFMVTFQRLEMLAPRPLHCGLKGHLCHTAAVITANTVTSCLCAVQSFTMCKRCTQTHCPSQSSR